MIAFSEADIKEDLSKYIDMAMQIIHSKATTANIQKQLTAGNHVEQVAKMAVMIMQRIDTATRDSGVETQDAVKVVAAQAIVGLLCELAEAAKLFDLSDDHKLLALSAAIQDYFKAEIAAKRIDPEKLKAGIGQNLMQKDPASMNGSRQATERLAKIAQEYGRSNGTQTKKKAGK